MLCWPSVESCLPCPTLSSLGITHRTLLQYARPIKTIKEKLPERAAVAHQWSDGQQPS